MIKIDSKGSLFASNNIALIWTLAVKLVSCAVAASYMTSKPHLGL